MSLPLPEILVAVAVGYLIGSIPTPYLIVRAATGVDLRDYRTGNVGVMNSGKALGRKGLVLVLLLELCKGMAAALLGRWIGGAECAWIALLAAVVGANWSIWLGWAGGRGNTAFAGGLLVIGPGLLLSLGLVWSVGRVLLGSAFRAARLNIITMPLQIAFWAWTQQPRELFAFYAFTGLIPTAIYLSRHRKATDDHMAFRDDQRSPQEAGG